jgi:hypothetical protein
MIANAPQAVALRRIRDKQFKKTLPDVPQRGPEPEFHRIQYDFHGSGVTLIDSDLFLQTRFL